MVKPFQNLLLQNRKSQDFDTWQTAKGPYKMFINDDTGLTLTYLTARSNLVLKTVHLAKIVVFYELKLGLI